MVSVNLWGTCYYYLHTRDEGIKDWNVNKISEAVHLTNGICGKQTKADSFKSIFLLIIALSFVASQTVQHLE